MLRKGGSSNGDHRALNSDDDIIRIPECDINDAKERFHLTLIGRVFHICGRSIDALIYLLPDPGSGMLKEDYVVSILEMAASSSILTTKRTYKWS